MEIGQTLNHRYTLAHLIGSGAMGDVYHATDTQTGQPVAVKLMARNLAFEPEMLERFRREGEALRQLRHPNIVGLVDTFPYERQQVIVMEYVPGGSLHQLIKQGPLPLERVRRIALELCDALTRAHHLNVVHRDLKPENVLLAEDGTPKLTDFGLARLVGESARLTGTGTQLGTPYYMSPEAWQGQPLDAQTDIWSLGVVLFEMLTGEVPFGGETLVAVMNRVLTAPLPDLKKLRADTPADLVKIVRRMLTRDKRKRYQSLREVSLDLERLNLSPGMPTAATPAAPPRPATKPHVASPTVKRPALVIPAEALVAAGVVLVVLCCVGASVGAWLGRDNLTRWAAQFAPTPTQTPGVLVAPTAAPVAAGKIGKLCFASYVALDEGDNYSGLMWKGVQASAKTYGAQAVYLYPTEERDYAAIIREFLQADCDLIIVDSFFYNDAVAAAAQAHPEQKFMMVDYDGTTPLGANVWAQSYAAEQAAALAGYAAASVTKTGKVAAFGGIQIPVVEAFLNGFDYGVRYYNQRHGANVVLLGWDARTQTGEFAGNFTEAESGKSAAQKLLQQGADVLFPVAGPVVGGGAADMVLGASPGVYFIGVDSDWAVDHPQYADITLTSVEKRFDRSITLAVLALADGKFSGGQHTGTLASDEVSLSPFHKLDTLVSAQTKTELAQFQADLAAGQIKVSAISRPLTLWYSDGGEQVNHWLAQRVAAWNAAHPEAYVTVASVPSDQNLWEKWGAGASDILWASVDGLPQAARAGRVKPLAAEQTAGLDKFSARAVAELTVDGRPYGVPQAFWSVALYYNKALVPTPPATTDELLQMVKNGKGFSLIASPYFVYGFFPAFGGRLLDDQGRCVADQGGGVAAALQYLKELKQAGAAVSPDYAQAQTLFEQGEAALTINGVWTREINQNALGNNVGVAPLPAGPQGQLARPLVGVDGFFVSADCANPEAAVQFAYFITEPENYQPGIVPARPEVKVSDPLLQSFADLMPNTTSPVSMLPWLNGYWDPFTQALADVLDNGVNPATAVKNACAAMNKANGK